MTTQPLTPLNPVIVLVALNENMKAEVLMQYGIPTDPGNVEPTLTVHRVGTLAEANALVNTAPSPLLPWCINPRGFEPLALRTIIDRLQLYFGISQTQASALSMRNNEYAINPKLLRA